MRALVVWGVTVALAACVSANQPSRKQAVEDRKQLASTNVQLGLGYLQQGTLDVAQQKLLIAVEQDPESPAAFGALALLSEQLGRTEDADRHYQKAIRLNAEDGIAHNNYGAFLCKQKRYADAQAQYALAVKDPLYATPDLAYENAGLCAEQAGNVAQAEENYRQALKLNPRLGVALMHMAKMSFEQKHYLPARAYVQRFEEAGEHDAATLWLAREIELALGDAERAEDYAIKLRQRFPSADETKRLSAQTTGGQQ